MQVYISREYWMPSSDFACLHCGGKIMYRPIPIGISRSLAGAAAGAAAGTAAGYSSSSGSGEPIDVCVGFCSWPCARTYADHNYPSDDTEQLTTRIMLDFKSCLSRYDDPDGWRFLQQYDRFSQLPRAPPRHAFTPFGSLTPDQYRARWVTSSLSRVAFGDFEADWTTRPSASSGRQARDIYSTSHAFGIATDADDEPMPVFRRAFTTKRVPSTLTTWRQPLRFLPYQTSDFYALSSAPSTLSLASAAPSTPSLASAASAASTASTASTYR